MSRASTEASGASALWARAQRSLPGGVSSPVRAYRAVGGVPVFVDRGQGPFVFDADGRRWCDWVQSYGALIAGHAAPSVVAAVAAALEKGTTFGAPTLGEVLLAEAVAERVPGVEKVRFTSSGTEATMTALRLARGATGRSVVVKFAGCYHGHSDALLAEAGSGVATLSVPQSVGVPPAAVQDTVVLPYNVVPELDSSVAAVLVEPVAANMGLVAPAAGFLEGLRQACDRVGALLVFDEVITGFRVGPGGASERFGVRPDLWCFGKVLGGGLPVGAVAGPAALMDQLAPEGPVYQAGTLSGNPLAMAAGLATLRLLDGDAYEQLSVVAASLASGLADAFAQAGVPATVPSVGPLVGLFVGSTTPPTDFASAQAVVGSGLYPLLFHGLLERGVMLAPGPYEALFPSLAHTPAEVDQTVTAAASAADELAKRAASQAG